MNNKKDKVKKKEHSARPDNLNTSSENVIADSFVKKDEERESHKIIGKIRNEIPMDKHIEWYYNEYAKQVEFNKLPNIKKSAVNLTNGPILRMQNISVMKFLYTYNTMDMVIVVMKLYDVNLRKETNFGTLFCEIIKPGEADLYFDVLGNVAFTYYSTSPSYISCDGEYRSQFVRFRALATTKRNFSEIWNEVETYVNRIVIRRQWSIYPNYFYPKVEQAEKNTEVEFAVKHESVPMTLLLISWFNTIYDSMVGMTKTHINQTYKDIFLKEKDADIAFIKELIRKYGEETIDAFKINMIDIQRNFQGNKKHMQCGYKMIPLNMKEVQDPLRIRYKPWREYLISNKCNDFVINSIAPGFSIILDWFYIKNSKKGLYDNKSQYDRMKNSEIAKDILRILYEAQRGTYFASENLQGINKTAGDIKNWVNPKFKKLKEKIDDPINYSIEEIIMSEVTLAFANEYVGRTFADCVTLVGSSKIFDSMIGHPFKDSGYDYFAKYVFDICYNLYCINSKLGLIHGDFHLNNATIGALYNPGKDFVLNKDKANRVVYVIDDEYQFVFPNNSYFGCLIDFSRAILNPHKYDLFVDKSIPSNYQLVADVDKFTANEINTLLSLYIQLFPNKQKQKDELIVIFKNHFNAVFRLLTCIDLYMFSIRLSRLLKSAMYPIGKRCIELIDKINKLAEVYITTDMNHLIGDPAGYSKKILSEDYPILSIIKKSFPEYIDGQAFKNIGVITDIYCYNNDFKHSLAMYDTYPDFLKYAKYVDDKGVLVDTQVVSEKRYNLRKRQERMKLANLEMMNFIAIRHGKKMV